jgi:hypothetical protein
MTDRSLSRWRDAEPDQFAATILAAAEELRILPLALEKDYWVCEALRAIAAAHRGEVVFKGGTSLEKLRIIRRFSEDLDLLVVGTYPSANATKNSMKRMIRSASIATLGEATPWRSGGNPGNFHRSAYLAPPLAHSTAATAVADTHAILIELGQSGGPNPSNARPVRSLLSRQLAQAGFDTDAWADLSAFEVAILHPGRTLIEKLLRVNNFATDPGGPDSAHGWARVGRQFYDIWALLGTDEVNEFLTDKSLVSEVLADCYQVSQAFTPDQPVPSHGFAASSVFDPKLPLAQQLRLEHNRAMDDLYYGTDVPPTFDDVITRVHDRADDLRIMP